MDFLFAVEAIYAPRVLGLALRALNGSLKRLGRAGEGVWLSIILSWVLLVLSVQLQGCDAPSEVVVRQLFLVADW